MSTSSTLAAYHRRHPAGASTVQVVAVPHDRITAALYETTSLAAREREADRAVKVAEAALQEARGDDLKAAATALRAGKTKPAAKATSSAEATLRDAQEQALIVSQASADAHEGLLRTIAEHRAEAEQACSEAEQAALDRIRSLAAEASDCARSWAEARRARSWLDDPHRAGVFKARSQAAALALANAADEDGATDAGSRARSASEFDEAWRAQRRLAARTREIERELVAGGVPADQAAERARDEAAAEARRDAERTRTAELVGFLRSTGLDAAQATARAREQIARERETGKLRDALAHLDSGDGAVFVAGDAPRSNERAA